MSDVHPFFQDLRLALDLDDNEISHRLSGLLRYRLQKFHRELVSVNVLSSRNWSYRDICDYYSSADFFPKQLPLHFTYHLPYFNLVPRKWLSLHVKPSTQLPLYRELRECYDSSSIDYIIVTLCNRPHVRCDFAVVVSDDLTVIDRIYPEEPRTVSFFLAHTRSQHPASATAESPHIDTETKWLAPRHPTGLDFTIKFRCEGELSLDFAVDIQVYFRLFDLRYADPSTTRRYRRKILDSTFNEDYRKARAKGFPGDSLRDD
jgi:hypothetical protein